ncbi:TolC family protein [uncultured Croceitalea sp.]|uniref:TolC family protein n=1 Tax=uncultured Croceitalea sp. TaxID=1798908 RepID=UPI003305CAE0
MNLKKFFFLLSFTSCLYGMAQKVWTLEECVAYAIEHNLQVKNLKFAEDTGKETYRQSIRNLLPNINASSGQGYNWGLNENRATGVRENREFYDADYRLDANLDLFQGFQKMNTIRASKFIYKATQEDVLQEKFLLAFRVMTAFYDIKFNQGLVNNAIEQLEISQTNYNLVEKQVELGVMAKADLYEAESTLLADKLLLTQNKNLLALSKLTLTQAMNYTESDDIELQLLTEPITNELSQNVSFDTIYEVAKETVPIINAQKFRVKAAKKQLQAIRGGLYPSILLSANMGTSYVQGITNTAGEILSFSDQIDLNFARYVGARMTIPLSLGWSSRSQVKQQKIAYKQALNNLEIQEQELFQLLQQLVQTNDALIVEYEQSNKRLQAQELAFDIAQKRFERGMINGIELGRAKNLFATAQNENLQVRLRLKVNRSTLDFYNNLPVFNIN